MVNRMYKTAPPAGYFRSNVCLIAAVELPDPGFVLRQARSPDCQLGRLRALSEEFVSRSHLEEATALDLFYSRHVLPE